MEENPGAILVSVQGQAAESAPLNYETVGRLCAVKRGDDRSSLRHHDHDRQSLKFETNPHGYWPQSNPRHHYTLRRRLTNPETDCSLGQVSGAVNRNIVPGSYRNHANNGNYRVFAPGGYSPGTITFTSNGAGTQFTNTTNSDHILRYGSVTTTISGDSFIGYSATIVGDGTNTSEWIAAANQYGGPEIFSSQLSAAASELEGICR